MNGALKAKIDLALGALDFNAGNWPTENRERHLLEQIALAKKHLQTDEDRPVVVGDVTTNKLEKSINELIENQRYWAEDAPANTLPSLREQANALRKAISRAHDKADQLVSDIDGWIHLDTPNGEGE